MSRTFLVIQFAAVLVASAAWVLTPEQAARSLAASTASLGGEPAAKLTAVDGSPIELVRTEPFRVQPLYNRPDLVSDDDLRMVLDKIRPDFPRRGTKSNYIEHALRVWGKTATFADEATWSGEEMVDYLTDHAKYAKAWDVPVTLLEPRGNRLSVKWGRDLGASVHHDHWLACLTEAGVSIDHPVFGPGRSGHTLKDILAEAVCDFELDEREVEWTAMAFGLWLPPTSKWIGNEGRQFNFDMLARRLARGDCYRGVCAGTHRVYSLMLLVRLDDEFDILSDDGRAVAWEYLEYVRDRAIDAQWEDGRWATDWPSGALSKTNPLDEPIYKQVIATGHHLEWLSIAPPELHPPAEVIENAMKWIITTTGDQTNETVDGHYTFYSHVGAALSNWRSEHPADAWRRLE